MPTGAMIASAKPEATRAVQAITADYRARLQEIIERAAMPHLLPPPGAQAYRDAGPDVTTGPRKPALEGSVRKVQQNREKRKVMVCGVMETVTESFGEDAHHDQERT